MYRYYVTDPIRFQKSIRVTIEHGHANNYSNDYSSCVFWYQTLPHARFPELPPAKERYPIEGNTPDDIAWSRLSELWVKYDRIQRNPNLEAIRNAGEFTPVSGCYARAHDAFVERDHHVTITESEKALAIIEKLQNKEK